MASTKKASRNIPMPHDWLHRMTVAPPHAGEIFREFFRQAGSADEVSQAECARRMGMSTNRLDEIERGKRGVSPETAVLFAAVSGTRPEFWYRLQSNHDLWQAINAMKGPA